MELNNIEIEPIDFEKEEKKHLKTNDCDDQECLICGYRECPLDEPLHFHHDGCPICIYEDERYI